MRSISVMPSRWFFPGALCVTVRLLVLSFNYRTSTDTFQHKLIIPFFIALLLGVIEWFAGARLAAFLDTSFCLVLLAIFLYLRLTGRHADRVLFAGVTGVMIMAPTVTLTLGGFVDSGARVM